MIRRIRERLTKNCAIRLSVHCDTIIAMRMQGIPFQKIEDWLIEQGKQYRIAAPTLQRNFAKTGIRIELPAAEQIAERWGGRMDIDIQREVQGLILLQKGRVSELVNREKQKQITNPGYFDRRVRQEMAELLAQVSTLQKLMDQGLGWDEEETTASGLPLTEEQEKALVTMLVGPRVGEMQDEDGPGQTTH